MNDHRELRIERHLERLEERFDAHSEDVQYIRGRLDEIAISSARVEVVVDQHRTIKNSLRHAWGAVLLALVSAGVALAKSFL
jgi:hypothetical protein